MVLVARTSSGVTALGFDAGAGATNWALIKAENANANTTTARAFREIEYFLVFITFWFLRVNELLIVCFVPFVSSVVFMVVSISDYLLFNEVLELISPVSATLFTSTTILLEFEHPIPDVINTETLPGPETSHSTSTVLFVSEPTMVPFVTVHKNV